MSPPVKKGEKLTDNPKDFMLRVRLDQVTLKKLDKCCAQKSLSRSEVVRAGIEVQFEALEK